jgi:hypothetical protein
VSYLSAQLFDFRGKFLALLSVLPLGRLFALDNLEEVQVLLFQLFLLQQKLVEAETRQGARKFTSRWVGLTRVLF